VHLAAFEGAKKSNGYSGGPGDLRKRKSAALAKAPEALPRSDGVFRGGREDPLALEDVNYGGRIKAPSAAKKNGALKKADVVFGKEAVAAAGTKGREQAKGLPGAESRGRNADAAGNFADAKEALRRARR
jgi:hypothetical protein